MFFVVFPRGDFIGPPCIRGTIEPNGRRRRKAKRKIPEGNGGATHTGIEETNHQRWGNVGEEESQQQRAKTPQERNRMDIQHIQ